MQTGDDDQHSEKAASITLLGGVAMGTGVIIGAGTFALTGQIAELAGPLFPLFLTVGALVTSLAAYSYIKISTHEPISGGVAMVLHRVYGSLESNGKSRKGKPGWDKVHGTLPAANNYTPGPYG
ncbi:amino acid permease [Aurantiacibacter zhengii]|nr:amino acid permease [Aurantiacibacter zhengii]